MLMCILHCFWCWFTAATTDFFVLRFFLTTQFNCSCIVTLDLFLGPTSGSHQTDSRVTGSLLPTRAALQEETCSAPFPRRLWSSSRSISLSIIAFTWNKLNFLKHEQIGLLPCHVNEKSDFRSFMETRSPPRPDPGRVSPAESKARSASDRLHRTTNPAETQSICDTAEMKGNGIIFNKTTS